MFGMLLVPLVVVAVIVALVARRRPHPEDPGRVPAQVALSFAAVVWTFGALFIAGETLTDPGGWVGAALVTSWLVPSAVLASLAWWHPSRARPVLVAATVLVVATFVWGAVASDGWRSFEDDHGPLRAIAVFALIAPLTLLGWRQPRAAGALLLTLGLAPLAIAALAGEGTIGLGSLTAAASPATLIGALYALADLRRVRPRRTGARRAPPRTADDWHPRHA